jgi:hypothetical protein
MKVLIVAILALASNTNAFVIQPAAVRLSAAPYSSQNNNAVVLQMADKGHDAVKEYKSGMSISRTDGDSTKDSIDVVMKFGGSSLANFERIDHVANLIKDQIALGYRPRAVVCSAMGKTTNNLLSAGDFALGKCMKLVLLSSGRSVWLNHAGRSTMF